MWQFHQRLRPFTAISFDLDDTLYDNKPVMIAAERHVADFIAQQCPETAELDVHGWRALRDKIALQNSELASNMTALRLATLEHGLTQYSVKNPKQYAEAAMAEFLLARNKVDIAPEVHELLAALAERYPLVAVSNGNADIHRIGLGKYFQAAYQPGNGLRGKPFDDLFVAASNGLKLSSPSELLHIGDHPVSDVQGALRFGAQALWYVPNKPIVEATWLPHARIGKLAALYDLL
ncbi:haloacid dehalogenase superfamily enzyme, subfamily IA [Idiomarina sp. A28L]|uniref:HAD-IA family hydrolase n=1 Tax=Idiomarina sp. A28L TaxID=1036674 RepID=UPI0002138E17|nr:HAD-IA family hydrolase [Idiomarina sp. A28L]EGN74264.1 haloacid dehalogenase superfamily enzyme, subfamily IA [Idiomarina sp. A28L]